MAVKFLNGIEVEGTMNIVASDIPNLDAGKITSGTFSTSRIPNLSASKITSGTINAARLPDLSGTYQPKGSYLTSIPAEYLTQTEGDARYLQSLPSHNHNTLYDSIGSADAVNLRIDQEVLPSIPTNNNQLTNGAGYITGYTETDTLDSVVSRNGSTGNQVNLSSSANRFNGHHYFDQYDSAGNHYPHYVSGSGGAVVNTRVYRNATQWRLFVLNGKNGSISWDGNELATQSYVTTQINNVIDSAPGALNTLNELAAALGDDSNFSTTIANNIGAVNTRIDAEVLPAIDAKQNAGNYFTDGDTVLNMANNDGLVYDDSTNKMYVKLDGTNREIYHTGNTSFLSTGGGTLTGATTIQTTGGAMLTLKDTNSVGDAATPYISFVDSAGTRQGYIGIGSSGSSKLYLEGLDGIQTNNPLSVDGTVTATGGNSSNWNTAYGWGNHASAGYTTNTGTITGVSTGAGLDGTASSGSVTISLDLSELTDMTAAVSPTVDEIILLDNGAERRKRFSEIFGSAAYQNTSAFETAGAADAAKEELIPLITTAQTTADDAATAAAAAQATANTAETRANTALDNIPTNNNQLTNGAGYLTATNDRVYITDSRGSARAPSYYNDRYAQWDFQNSADTGVGGDSWHGILTVSKWSSWNASHRQEQLIFSGDHLWRRTASSDSAWGDNKKIWDSGNLDAFVSASVSNDTITFTKANGGTVAVTTSDANTNTWRGIHDVPVDGATTTSISSNWAFDNVKTPVPTNAKFTDTNTQLTDAQVRSKFSAGTNVSISAAGVISATDTNTQLTDAQVRSKFSAGTNVAISATGVISSTDTNTWRPIDSTPTNGATGDSISSDWAYDNVRNFSSGGNSLAGSFTATGDITAFSDARVKENVETIHSALEKVTSMRGVTYNKIGDEKSSMGVIAQEIQEVAPEVVRENEDGMLSVAYGNITAVLIEAIKEQQKQIEELKSRLDGVTK